MDESEPLETKVNKLGQQLSRLGSAWESELQGSDLEVNNYQTLIRPLMRKEVDPLTQNLTNKLHG